MVRSVIVVDDNRYVDLSPFLRQQVKAQNTANGGFEPWDCLGGNLHVSSS